MSARTDGITSENNIYKNNINILVYSYLLIPDLLIKISLVLINENI